ncbi:MAG: molybdenum cofactor guanylyltransferase [Desulfomicrobiaceae bacterium]
MSAFHEEVWGLVLAGGLSSRLGRDKALLPFHGVPLVERAVALLSRVCPRVAVSSRRMLPGLPILLDATERVGPLGGVLTALEAWQRPVLVLACDMPRMEEAALVRLLAARRARPAHALMTVWARYGTPYIEALAAVYEPAAAASLRQGLTMGVYQLSRLIPASHRHHLPYTEAEAHWFFNVNTPEDLAQLHAVCGAQAREHSPQEASVHLPVNSQ